MILKKIFIACLFLSSVATNAEVPAQELVDEIMKSVNSSESKADENNVNDLDAESSALNHAVKHLDVGKVENYLSLGVDPNSSAGTYEVPLIEMVRYSRAAEYNVFGYLSEDEKKKLEDDASYQEFKHQLESAEKILYLLLENNADPNIKDNSNKTPLMAAADSGNVTAVQALLDKGADINLRDNKGKTALINAINNQHWGLVLTLIKNGADVMNRYERYKGVSEWPLQTIISHYVNYLKDGRTRGEEEYESVVKVKLDKSDSTKTKLTDSIQESLSADKHGDLSHLFGSNTVEDIDYGATEFKDLLVTYIEAFPKDYVLDLDETDNSILYGYIYKTEGVAPEVKDATSKVKVNYKTNGLWFHTNTYLMRKGEIDIYPKHSIKGFMETFNKDRAAVK